MVVIALLLAITAKWRDVCPPVSAIARSVQGNLSSERISRTLLLRAALMRGEGV